MKAGTIRTTIKLNQEDMRALFKEADRIKVTLGKDTKQQILMTARAFLNAVQATTAVAPKFKKMKTKREVRSAFRNAEKATKLELKARDRAQAAQNAFLSARSPKEKAAAQRRMLKAQSKAYRASKDADALRSKAYEGRRIHVYTDVEGWRRGVLESPLFTYHGMTKEELKADPKAFLIHNNYGLAKKAWSFVAKKTGVPAAENPKVSQIAEKAAQENSDASKHFGGFDPYVYLCNNLDYAGEALNAGGARGQSVETICARAAKILKVWIDHICEKKFGFVPEEVG